jgi:PAS domain-containing protein
VSGKTGKYLELPSGKTNWNVFAMAREGLRSSLFGAFQKALLTNGSVSLAGVKAGDTTFAVTVEALKAPTLRGMVMVVFSDAARANGRPETPPQSRRASRLDLERDLEAVRNELFVNRQEMQCSEEELRAANEEHQSVNEELQSTNEELMTSKEEMQSMNEELQTLNHELRAKVEELSDASNDMRNLLDSTEIAILFLDGAFNVRRFTPEAAKLIRLIPGDVGRPLTDLVSNLRYPEMHEDAREVLRTLLFKEKSVPSQNGKWFCVRIMPYRTIDNRIDGLVITFTSIRKESNDAPL